MRAVTYDEYGGPEVLRLRERESPRCSRNEILIRVIAAGVNPIDARLRGGEMKGLLPGGFPRVPGYDVAGEVISAASGVGFRPGQRVLAFLNHLYGGGYAESANCGVNSAAPLPDTMTYEEAAALPLAGSTALQSLRDCGHLTAGDSVLINGASGGVGAIAVQIARAYGATVTGVASGAHEDFVRSLGASHFADYHTQDVTQADRNWDLIFDVAGTMRFTDARRVLAPRGTFVSTEPSLRGLLMSVITWPRKQQGRVMLARAREQDLRELTRLWSNGALRITVAESFPLERAADAHRRIENDHFCGKLVICPVAAAA